MVWMMRGKALLMLASAFMITVQVVDSSQERSLKKPANNQERSSTLGLRASTFDKGFTDHDVEDGKTAYPKNLLTAENPSKAKERLHPKNRIQRNVDTERCPNGMYGDNCTMPCSVHCQGNCNRSTGFCSGCKDKGHYGKWCEKICVDCNNLACNFFNGNCREENTDTEGRPKTSHGDNCNIECPTNCQGDCERHTGVCFGCKKKGQYGERCDQFCGLCNNKKCYYFNGECLDGINMSYVIANNMSTTTMPNHGSVINTDAVTESHTWGFIIITILSIVIIFLIIIILVFLFGFTCMPKFLSSCFPAWYPEGGLVGLRRDHIESSGVQEQTLLSSSRNNV